LSERGDVIETQTIRLVPPKFFSKLGPWTEILMKQAQRKRLSGIHSNFKWYTQHKSQKLATEGHREWRINYCKYCQITVRNANKFMSLRYNNSDRPNS